MKRLILEMGQGMDVHGQDYNKAAVRAIHDALRHSSLALFGSLDLDIKQMQVFVTIGVQQPDALDTDKLAAELPRGIATVTAAFGGHDILETDGKTSHVIATAAIEAFYPIEPADWVLSQGADRNG